MGRKKEPFARDFAACKTLLPASPRVFSGLFMSPSHRFLLSQNMKIFSGIHLKPVRGYSFSSWTSFLQLQWAYLCPCWDMHAISPSHVHIDLGEQKITHAGSCQLPHTAPLHFELFLFFYRSLFLNFSLPISIFFRLYFYFFFTFDYLMKVNIFLVIDSIKLLI